MSVRTKEAVTKKGTEHTDGFVLAKLKDFGVVPLQGVWISRLFRDIGPF